MKFPAIRKSNSVSKKERKDENLIADGDANDALAGEEGRLGGAADGGEAALAERASGLDLGPLHDADEAVVMVAAFDLPPAESTFREADTAAIGRRFISGVRRRRWRWVLFDFGFSFRDGRRGGGLGIWG